MCRTERIRLSTYPSILAFVKSLSQDSNILIQDTVNTRPHFILSSNFVNEILEEAISRHIVSVANFRCKFTYTSN